MNFMVILLLIASYTLTKCNVHLSLLHLGDMRGKFLLSTLRGTPCHPGMKKLNVCYGGLAKASYVIKKYKQKEKNGEIPPIVFLSNGNLMTGGTLTYVNNSFDISADIMNFLAPDCVSMGMHEFDKGVHGVREYVRQLKVPVVVSNLNQSTVPFGVPVLQSHILDIKGEKVGVLGYVTTMLSEISVPETIKTVDEIEALTRETIKLSTMGVKIIIALGCSGIAVDERIAFHVPYIDVIVGGMSPLLFYNGHPPGGEEVTHNYPYIVVQHTGKKVAIVYSHPFTKYVGFLNMTFNKRGKLIKYNGNPLPLTREVPEDPDAVALLKKYEAKTLSTAQAKVGQTSVRLDGLGAICSVGECNLGNMITDALVTYAATVYRGSWAQAPMALIHTGMIKMGIDAVCSGGAIYQNDLTAVMPYQNKIVIVSLLGKYLRLMLEQSMKDTEQQRIEVGDFLQVSGMKIVYATYRKPQNRVMSIRVRCGQCPVPYYEPLIPEQAYNVVMPQYLAKGHHSFYNLLPKRIIRIELLDKNDVEIVLWYFSKRPSVNPEIQGRILVRNTIRPESMAVLHPLPPDQACFITLHLVVHLSYVHIFR